jgi:hypothetical protein
LPKFTDLPKSHWANLYITRLTCEDAINGYPDSTFKPSNNITRAEFVKVVLGALLEVPPAPPASQHWATNIMSTAVKNNLLDAEEFAQDTWENPINRQEMAKIMARGAQYVRKEAQADKDSAYTSKVTDFNSIPEGYRSYVAQVYAKGIVGGYPDGSFGGSKQATRAEAAAMVVRLIDPIERLTVAFGTPDAPAIAFNPAVDVAADGRMKLEKAEEYMMATLKTLKFFEEGGKFYIEGNVAEVPEGFRNRVSISVQYRGGGVGYATYPYINDSALPKVGLFKMELTEVSNRDHIGGVLITLYIDTPNHTNTTYDKYGYEVIWTIDSDNDNRIDVSDYLKSQNRSSKFYDLSTIFTW